jgi:hypothetical protein
VGWIPDQGAPVLHVVLWDVPNLMSKPLIDPLPEERARTPPLVTAVIAGSAACFAVRIHDFR